MSEPKPVYYVNRQPRPTIRATVTLTEAQYDHAKNIGEGNVSKGVQVAIDAHRGAPQPPPPMPYHMRKASAQHGKTCTSCGRKGIVSRRWPVPVYGWTAYSPDVRRYRLLCDECWEHAEYGILDAPPANF